MKTLRAAEMVAAENILDRPNADPDDDAAIVARAVLRLADPQPDSQPPTPRDLPQRVVVGANGAYWRDYGDHYSMCPVSEDNDPVEVVAIYNRQEADATAWDRGFAAGLEAVPDSQPPTSEPMPDAIEYDERNGHLIATNRLGPKEYGASAIVARDVYPSFGRRVVAALVAAQATPEPLDVERLAAAMHEQHRNAISPMACCGQRARRIAAEYDRSQP